MEKKTIIIQLVDHRSGTTVDIETPSDITANELIVGLNDGLHLGMNSDDLYRCYLSTENPIALVKGNRTLAEFGLRDGSVINIT